MKKITDKNELAASSAQFEKVNDDGSDSIDTSSQPVLPGTEEPRSLGDLMREAEALQNRQSADADPAVTDKESSTDAASNSGRTENKRRSKRPSRAQTRRFARERALQGLYQWEVSAGQSSSVRKEFLDNQDMSRVDVDYFITLFNGVSHHPQALDDALQSCLDRPINELDPIERCVLRIAAFELLEQSEIPARVIINEGIEITKRFGADKGHRYVNGVLDKLATRLRTQEMQRK